MIEQRQGLIDAAGELSRLHAGQTEGSGQLLPGGRIAVARLHQIGSSLNSLHAELHRLVRGSDASEFQLVHLNAIDLIGEAGQRPANLDVF